MVERRAGEELTVVVMLLSCCLVVVWRCVDVVRKLRLESKKELETVEETG
jgi:hypothetical protein